MVYGFLILAGLALLGSVFFSRHDDDWSGPELPTGWWLLLPALALQLLWQRWLSTTPFGVHWIWVLPASYVPLFLFLFLNRRSKGVWLIGAGAAMNFAAMALNGGGMPILLVPPPPLSSHLADAGWILPHTKDRVLDLATASPLLRPLADRFTVVLPGGLLSVFSFGDLFILSGGFLAVFSVLGFDLAPMARSIRRFGRAS